MATNPMQRKARNSFLLGMLVMLLIAGIAIGFLVYLLVDERKEKKQQELSETQVFVLNSSVKSGQIITSDMLSMQTVSTRGVPSNAIADVSTFQNYSLIEKNTGNAVETDQNGLYINENGTKVRVISDGINYYKTVNNQRQLVEFLDVPLVAKVDMEANSVVTLDLIAKSDEIADDDLRIQEYNMLSLPVKLGANDYIDIRLTLPNGLEYIVVSKKRVLDVMENTIWLKMTEEELLTMSNAIVEAYIMTGSKLAVNLYVEPGLQEAATPTYVVSQTVYSLIQSDPNIEQRAKAELANRYAANNNALATQRANEINSELGQYGEQALSNIEQKIQQENTARQELRERYLQELSTATGVTR